MARVTAVTQLDGCLDSAPVKDVFVDPSVDEALMRRVAALGELQYFPDFPRPFFRISSRRGWVAQGVLGNSSFRVTFFPSAAVDAEDQLRLAVEGSCDG